MTQKSGRKKTVALKKQSRPAPAAKKQAKSKQPSKPKQPSKKARPPKAVKSTAEVPAQQAMPPPVPAKPAVIVPKSPFGARELREFQELLLKMRAKLTGQITSLVQDSLTLAPGEGDLARRSEEEGSESFERDIVLTRASQNQGEVFEIDEALARIQIKTFGVCEGCFKNIEKARLQALPHSRLCVRCKSEWEQSQQRRRSFEPLSLFPASDRSAPDASDEE